MRSTLLFRSALSLAIASAALGAQAVQIGLTSSGNLDLTGSPAGTVDEVVLLQQGGFGPLALLHMDFVNTAFPVLGNGTYSGAGGTLNFDYTWTTDSQAGGAQALLGTWTATGGTGTYLGATGAGTITTNLDVSGGTEIFPSFTTFRGSIQAVPEPASFAALGVGAVALLRRRRKA